MGAALTPAPPPEEQERGRRAPVRRHSWGKGVTHRRCHPCRHPPPPPGAKHPQPASSYRRFRSPRYVARGRASWEAPPQPCSPHGTLDPRPRRYPPPPGWWVEVKGGVLSPTGSFQGPSVPRRFSAPLSARGFHTRESGECRYLRTYLGIPALGQFHAPTLTHSPGKPVPRGSGGRQPLGGPQMCAEREVTGASVTLNCRLHFGEKVLLKPWAPGVRGITFSTAVFK